MQTNSAADTNEQPRRPRLGWLHYAVNEVAPHGREVTAITRWRAASLGCPVPLGAELADFTPENGPLSAISGRFSAFFLYESETLRGPTPIHHYSQSTDTP